MKKKWIWLLIISCCVLIVCFGLYVRKDDKDIEQKVSLSSGLELTYGHNQYNVTGYNGNMPIVEIPSEYNGIPITAISSLAFSDTEQVMSVAIPEEVTEIGSKAFIGSNIQSIFLPKSLKMIGAQCFDNCDNLSIVYYEGNTSDWINISFIDKDSNPMFFADDIYLRNSQNEFAEVTEITLPENLVELQNYAFAGFNKVTNINFSNNLEKIGEYAFYNCSSLQSLILPETLNSIGLAAFYGCSGITRLELPSQLGYIASRAFNNCSNLENIYYYGNVESWCNINLKSTPVPQAMRFYMKDENQEWAEVSEITIPDTITEIKENTFYGFTSLTKIHLHDSITSLGMNAFRNCGISSITIPKTLTNFGPYAFEDCNNLQTVYYDGTINDWCNNEFYYSTSTPMHKASEFYIKNGNEYNKITTINIPNNITEIKNYTFYGFEQITELNIPNNIITIGKESFAECLSLIDLKIPESVTKIKYGAFIRCSGIVNITLTANLIDIESNAFSVYDVYTYTNNLSNIYFEGTILQWMSIDMEDNPMQDAEHFFLKNEDVWTEVTKIDSPEGVIEIKNLSWFDNIISITLPSTVTVIGNFNGCDKLESFEIPEGVKKINQNAFYGCDNMEYIIIPISMEEIGAHAFLYAYGFNIYYNGSAEDWNNIDINQDNEDLNSAPIYYYIENENDVPTDGGNYWHYDTDGKTPVVWEI